jgi:hypothetical protein
MMTAFDSPPSMEQRISRLERLMYLVIGLQVPALIPLIGVL